MSLTRFTAPKYPFITSLPGLHITGFLTLTCNLRPKLWHPKERLEKWSRSTSFFFLLWYYSSYLCRDLLCIEVYWGWQPQRPVTMEARLPCGSFHVGFMVALIRFLSEFSSFPCQYHFTVTPYSYLIWGQTKDPLVAILRHCLTPSTSTIRTLQGGKDPDVHFISRLVNVNVYKLL